MGALCNQCTWGLVYLDFGGWYGHGPVFLSVTCMCVCVCVLRACSLVVFGFVRVRFLFFCGHNRRAWLKAVEAEPRAIWIVKPPASSCGRGIRVINKASVASVSKSKKGLVQVKFGCLKSTTSLLPACLGSTVCRVLERHRPLFDSTVRQWVRPPKPSRRPGF